MTLPLAPAMAVRLALSELLVNANAISRRIAVSRPKEDPRAIGASAYVRRASATWAELIPTGLAGSPAHDRFEEATLRAMAILAHDLNLFVNGHLADASLGPAFDSALRAQAATWRDFETAHRKLLPHAPLPEADHQTSRFRGRPTLRVVGGREAA